jgi:hypothetical protein
MTNALYGSGSRFLGSPNARCARRSQRGAADNDGSGVLLVRTYPQIGLLSAIFGGCPQHDASQIDRARNPRDHEPNQKPFERNHIVHFTRTPRRTLTLVNELGFQLSTGTCYLGTAVVHRTAKLSSVARESERVIDWEV